MRAPRTTNHMRPCCHVSDSNRNISLSFEVCPGEWGRIIRCQAQGLADEVAQDGVGRSEEHTSELQSRGHLVCRLLLEKKKKNNKQELSEQRRHRDNQPSVRLPGTSTK